MERIQKYIGYAYLVAAVILFYEGIVQFSKDERQGWIMLFLGFLAMGMFFLKRKIAYRYRK